MPKVSVVVPVYRVEKIIERCARSLFGQTLDDIEFIFVDDCTPDESISVLKSILQEYPNRIKQTKIIHHNTNLGLPLARQTGIKEAKGEYIAHCDSDDWVDLDTYEILYRNAVKDDRDAVIFDCITTDGTNTLSIINGGSSVSRDDYINDMMHRKMWWSLCNKLIRRELYINNSINYPTDGMGEDMCLTLQLLYACKSISYNHNVFYYYYQNPTSITQTQTEDKCLIRFYQICRNVEKVKQFYSDKQLSNGIMKGLRYLEYNAKFPLLPLLANKQFYKLWRNSFKGCEWSVVCDNNAELKERFRAFLCIMGLYPFPRNKYSYQLKS